MLMLDCIRRVSNRIYRITTPVLLLRYGFMELEMKQFRGYLKEGIGYVPDYIQHTSFFLIMYFIFVRIIIVRVNFSFSFILY
jgi:hypothetical protein